MDTIVAYNKLSLICAIRERNWYKVVNLIRANANVNAKDHNGITVLMTAVVTGYLDLVRILIEKGVEINAKDNKNNTALIYAACWGHIDIVMCLINNNANINAKDKDGNTILMTSIVADHADIIKILMKEEGVDLDSSNKNGDNALLLAVKWGHSGLVRDLIDANVDINVKDNKNNTALMSGSLYGYLKIVKMLVEKGIDVNKKNISNDTALSCAVKGKSIIVYNIKRDHLGIVKELIKQGSCIIINKAYCLFITSDMQKLINIAKESDLLFSDISFKIDTSLIEKSDLEIFLSRFKISTIKNGFNYNDYQLYINALINNRSVPKEAKKQLVDFFTQTVIDINLEFASILHKTFGITSYPLTNLIELRQEGIKLKQNINHDQNFLKESQAIVDLVIFYQQHFNFSYNLLQYLEDGMLNQQQITTLTNEVILANMKIVTENYERILAKDCIAETEMLIKLSLPKELKFLLQRLLTDYQLCENRIEETIDDDLPQPQQLQQYNSDLIEIVVIGQIKTDVMDIVS